MEKALRILVIDDMDAGGCIQNLTTQGVLPEEIEVASSYQDAEDKLKNGRYDVAMIDGRLDEGWGDCEGRSGGDLLCPESTIKIGISGQGRKKGLNFENHIEVLSVQKKAILKLRIELLERAKNNMMQGFDEDSETWVRNWNKIKPGLKWGTKDVREQIEQAIEFEMENWIHALLDNPEQGYEILQKWFNKFLD